MTLGISITSGQILCSLVVDQQITYSTAMCMCFDLVILWWSGDFCLFGFAFLGDVFHSLGFGHYDVLNFHFF